MADRNPQMFPTLDAAQLARASAHGRRRPMRAGEILREPGQRGPGAYVVLSGAIEILAPAAGGGDELIVVHDAGSVAGDTHSLLGRATIVRMRARADGEIVELERAEVLRLVQTDAELGELLMRAFILRRVALMARGMGDLVLVGSRHSAATHRLREFLAGNGYPYGYVDVERDPDVQALLDRFGVGVADVPIVICRAERVLRNPSIQEVADLLGLNAAIDETSVRDLVVVGAGPAGLAAGVYAASEGLGVLVVEAGTPGGQAASSSRIENYLGFPTGVSGAELAGRAYAQVSKFGADVAVAAPAARLGCDRRPYRVELGNGSVPARAIVIATGAQYRRLPLPELARFEGTGVYYSATHLEAQLCQGEEVIVVGGGNSAGQAAVFLSGFAAHVHVLVRGRGLADSMSRYLIRRIEDSPKITLKTRTEIESLEGNGDLEQVRWRDGASGTRESHAIGHVFSMTGAVPNTEWLRGCVALDAKGFVCTGPDLSAEDLARARWPLARPPFLLETSRPGVFAVGDVRSGSVKRVAAAVGEGSICVQLVHKVLAE